MLGTRRGLFLAVVSAAALSAPAPSARAESPPKIDYADGMSKCEEFEAKNERELDEWSKTQPATPYQYPRRDNVVNAPWGKFLHEAGQETGLILATLIPHAGAQARGSEPAAIVSWPWSFPLFPATTCSRTRGTFVVDKYRSHRLMFEPGISSSNRGIGTFIRPGYRFLYHPSDWVLGVGGGLGTNIELAGNRESFRASLSPEVVIQFGHCCSEGYFTFALRFDKYFSGGVKEIFSGSLGYTFF
ncbi:MAG: hypothetical protein JST00_11660 [Deltaproteobacteria bacterium]|nr:hypothetical protein [Deltaproteobacteria bacterium]